MEELTREQRLKHLRLKLGLSQKEFANRLGITNVSISYLEHGVKKMSSATRNLVLREFNVNPLWLDSGEGDMFLEMSDNDKLVMFVDEVLKSSNSDIRKRLLSALSRIPSSQWNAIADILETISKDI